jgi:CHAD domain-containing protein
MASVVLDGRREPSGPIIEVLEAEGIVLGPPELLRRTRYDTFDGRLRGRGLRLEARTQGSEGHALVVTAGNGPPARLFLSAPLVPTEPLTVTALPPGPLRSRLVSTAADRALLPQVTLRSLRRSGTAVDADGIPLVTVHLDGDLEITRPGPGPGGEATDSLAWTIEVEELPGRHKPARELLRTLRRALTTDAAPPQALDGDALERAAVAAGVDRRGWQGPVRPDLDRKAAALIGVRQVLRSFDDALESNWDGTVHHLDDEFLHDLRIAVRQTRSLLTESRRILPKDVRRQQREAFRWLGTVTSPARDLDVYVAGWQALTSPLPDADARALEPVLAHLAGQQAIAHAEVAQALRSRTARQLRDQWRAWLELPDSEVIGGKQAGKPLGDVIGSRIMEAQQQLLTDGRRIDHSSPASQLHELRKDGKRLRYLLEGFGHLGGRKRSRAVIRSLKDLQDNLGAHQDAEVQADRLRQALAELSDVAGEEGAGELSPATLAAGERLATILDARQATERADFHDRFAAYDDKRARRTVEDLVARMSR